MTHQLAQINIGRLLAPIDDPQIADFVRQLDEVNALADSFAGFSLVVSGGTGGVSTGQGTEKGMSGGVTSFSRTSSHSACVKAGRRTIRPRPHAMTPRMVAMMAFARPVFRTKSTIDLF